MKRLSVHVVVFFAAIFFGIGIAFAQFDGAPSSPQAFTTHSDYLGWDVQVHSRDQNTWGDNSLTSMAMDHGDDCGAPPATHTNTSYAGAVFICKDHLMTGIQEEGYGMIALTPNKMVDFSNGPAVIDWDMSTYRSSDRDWVDFWVTPLADNLTLPFSMGAVDLQGPPSNAVQVHMTQFNGKTDFMTTIYRDGTVNDLKRYYKLMQDYLTPSKTRRDHFQLIISQNHVKFWMPDYNLVWEDVDMDPLSFTQGVFQIGYHSYNPLKGACLDNCPGKPSASTFHWDNVNISPNIPFTVIHSNMRSVVVNKGGDAGAVTFLAPAPADSYLRFSAFGDTSVSFDGGATYIPAVPQEKIRTATASYYLPIPAGTQSVNFRFGPNVDGWYTGPFIAQDFAIWVPPAGLASTGGSPAPNPSPTPTDTPSATPTPSVSPTPSVTPTPSETPTPTDTPSPTATATATSTPSPTATSTPTATATSSPTATSTNTPAPTATRTPTFLERLFGTATPTKTPTKAPTGATATRTPTRAPSTPSRTSTPARTATPTRAVSTPTKTATKTPTKSPTATPRKATATSTPRRR